MFTNFTTKSQPLAQNFFIEMLSLEMQFTNKAYTILTIKQLRDMYLKAIEYYALLKDPITTYFTEKLNMTLIQSDEYLNLNMPINSVKSNNNDHSTTKHASRKSVDFQLDKNGNIDFSRSTQNFSLTTTNMSTKTKNITLFPSPNVKRNEISENKDSIQASTNEKIEPIEKVEIFIKPSSEGISDFKKTAQARLERAKYAYQNMKKQEYKVSKQRVTTSFAQKFFESALQNDKIIRKDLAKQAENLRKKIEKRSLEARGLKNPNKMTKLSENKGNKDNVDIIQPDESPLFILPTSVGMAIEPQFDSNKSTNKLIQENLIEDFHEACKFNVDNNKDSDLMNKREYNNAHYDTQPDESENERNKNLDSESTKNNPFLTPIHNGGRTIFGTFSSVKENEENNHEANQTINKIFPKFELKNLSTETETENINGIGLDEIKQKLIAMKKKLRRGTTTVI